MAASSQTGGGEDSTPRQGSVGHVAALGEADISRFASYDWESDGGEFQVNVYLCGPPGRFRSDLGTDPDGDGNLREGEGEEIHQAVGGLGSGTLSAKVERFFARESRGLLELNFYPVMAPHQLLTPAEQFAAGWDAVFADQRFNGLSPLSIDWMTTTMDSMYNDAAAGSLSACDHAVITRQAAHDNAVEAFEECLDENPDYSPPTDTFFDPAASECPFYNGLAGKRSDSFWGQPTPLVLVGVPFRHTAGFANYGGIARVSLNAAGGDVTSDEFAFIVAHELGHSILHLGHTDDLDGADCGENQRALMRSNSRCPTAPMGADGLMGYEITCGERRQLGWQCEYEPPTDEWINDQFKEVFFFDSSFAQVALDRYRADGSCVNRDFWWDNAADALEQLYDVAELHPGDQRIIDLAGVWAGAEVGDLREMAQWARSQKLDLNFWEPDCEAWARSTERYLEWLGSLAPVECEHDEQGVFICGRA